MSTQLDPTTQRLSELIDDVTQSFTNNPANNVVIDERFFVEVFLPMFAGDENAPPNVTPEMWLNLAHGPFNEVTVVDTNREVLFVVPPMADQSAIKPLDGTGADARLPSVSDMVTSARLYSQRGSQAVQNVLSKELGRRSFMFNKKDMNTDHIARWNAIFARYNRPLLPTTATATTESAPTNANLARDSSEFDELG